MKLSSVGYLLPLFIMSEVVKDVNSCIQLLNSQWQPISLEERTIKAEVVLTAKILSTKPIIDSILPTTFYSATFEVITILKGWDILKKLYYEKNSKSIIRLYPNIVAYAIGFGDSRLCFSSVEVGESYALFLGYKRATSELVAKYDDLFGAAELLYKRTERAILKSLGWEEWSAWSPCSKSCSRGTQQRSRKCQKSSQQLCHGPKEQMKDCNLYSCSNSTDVLSFIRNYESNVIPVWRTSAFSNRIDQERRVLAAPTYMLFDNEFPRNSVLHISFKGPVTDSQFLFSVYSVNEKMEFGIMLSPFSLEFKYNKKIDAAVNIPITKRFSFTFTKNKWYNLGILLKNEEVQLKLDCEETVATVLEEQLFNEFDIYGKMYLGADESFGKERNVKVKVGQITLVKDPESFEKQCGRINLEPPDQEKAKDEQSGDGSIDTIDDSESGDVDEEMGSGELVCSCVNGGICQQDKSCMCPHGWSGTNCEKPMCYKKCLNGGTCTKPRICTCVKGTKGRYCQIKECPGECKNGGTCGNDGKCRCTNIFHGEQCEHPKKCKRYIRKRIAVTKPTVVYTMQDVWTPCADNKTEKCLTKKLKYMKDKQVEYKRELICET